MSRRAKPRVSAAERAQAPIFAALGDQTRLRLMRRLAGGRSHSISELTEGFALTRQAVTKHLRILENAGLVEAERQGREIRFEFRPGAMDGARQYLEAVTRQWSEALDRLKAFVESDSAD